LVDFNGDEILSAEEFSQFSKECFLPLLHHIKETHKWNMKVQQDFHPASFLYRVYELLVDELEGDVRPALLTFLIDKYTGDKHDDSTSIKNIFSLGPPHRSGPGKNFDLILRAKKSSGAWLTNFYIGGRSPYCDHFLKDALVWFSEKPPQWSSYSKQFNDFTQKQFSQLPANFPNKPDVFISTNPETYSAELDLDQPKKVTYIHIKFLSFHPPPSDAKASTAPPHANDPKASPAPPPIDPKASAAPHPIDPKAIATPSPSSDAKGGSTAAPPPKDPKASTTAPPPNDPKASTAAPPPPKDAKASAAPPPPNDPKVSTAPPHNDPKVSTAPPPHPDDPKVISVPPLPNDPKASTTGHESESIDVEFLGLWGFPAKDEGPPPAHRMVLKANTLYSSLIGASEGETTAADLKKYGSAGNMENLLPASMGLLSVASSLAEGLYPNVKLGFSQADIETLLKQLPTVEPPTLDAGSSGLSNPASLLIELLPLLHLFRLFYGYSAKKILTKPM